MSWRPKEGWENLCKDDPRFGAIEELIFEIGANKMLEAVFPYLFGARGELMDLLPLIENGDRSHLLKVRNLINSLNEIVVR